MYQVQKIYCILFSVDGSVYVWGGGSEGQLGLGLSTQDVSEPVLLNLNEKVKGLACGYYHTAVVTGNTLNICTIIAWQVFFLSLSPVFVVFSVNRRR